MLILIMKQIKQNLFAFFHHNALSLIKGFSMFVSGSIMLIVW